jgi:hypothetical protein
LGPLGLAMSSLAARPVVGGEVRGERGHPSTDMLLTHNVCRIAPGLGVPARPAWGAVSEMSPQPGAAPSRARCCCTPPDTVAAGVARQRPKAIPNQGCGGVTNPAGRNAGGDGRTGRVALAGARASGSPALAPPLIDTIAHPRAPRPRRLTRQSRSSTLARGLSPSRRRHSGVSGAT